MVETPSTGARKRSSNSIAVVLSACASTVFERYRLDRPHADTGGRQRGGHDPRVAAIVARAGENEHTGIQTIAKSERDLGRGRGAGSLHQRARRRSAIDRRGVTRRRLRTGDDADEVSHVVMESR